MFDLNAPVDKKTFIAILPIGYRMHEKLPHPTEMRLELFDKPKPEPGDQSRIYADAIRSGETGTSVLERIMKDVFHVSEWMVEGVVGQEMAKDSDGTDIPRIFVSVMIPEDQVKGQTIHGLYPRWQFNTRPMNQAESEEVSRWLQIFLTTGKDIFGISFDFSPASLSVIDQKITEAWGKKPPENLDTVKKLFGAYLGEIMRRELGARWVFHDGVLVMEIKTAHGSTHLPNVFGKVEKRFLNGEEDSLAYFFHSVKKIVDEGLPE